MLRVPSEPVGLVGGDQVAAMFRFDHGLHGYFGSHASDDHTGGRFGVTLYGTSGLVFLPLFAVPSEPPYLLRAERWVSDGKVPWTRVDYPAGSAVPAREEANRVMALDLLEAIETNRHPICSAMDGCWTIEMVAGVYQSQFARSPISFPLNRRE
jgi:hypothetical protein